MLPLENTRNIETEEMRLLDESVMPLEITIRDIENTEAIDTRIRKKAEKLVQIYDRITFCHVVVEALQKNQHQGKMFQVSIELNVPGKVLVANKNSHRNEDLYVAIRDSFKAIQRQLEDYTEIQKGHIKHHQAHQVGTVVRLFPDYGFIETADGNEYYFHESNLLQLSFEDLLVGTQVRFFELTGGETLQAHQITSV